MSNIVVRDSHDLQSPYFKHEDSYYLYNAVKNSLIMKDNDCPELAKRIYLIYMKIFQNETPSLLDVMSEIECYNEELIFDAVVKLMDESDLDLSAEEYEEYTRQLLDSHMDYISQVQSYEVYNSSELFACEKLSQMSLSYLIDPSMNDIVPDIADELICCNDCQNILVKSFMSKEGIYGISGDLYLSDMFNEVVE